MKHDGIYYKYPLLQNIIGSKRSIAAFGQRNGGAKVESGRVWCKPLAYMLFKLLADKEWRVYPGVA
jgi:hypothetical protein